VLGVEIGTLATIEALESVRVLLAHAQAEAKARDARKSAKAEAGRMTHNAFSHSLTRRAWRPPRRRCAPRRRARAHDADGAEDAEQDAEQDAEDAEDAEEEAEEDDDDAVAAVDDMSVARDALRALAAAAQARAHEAASAGEDEAAAEESSARGDVSVGVASAAGADGSVLYTFGV
jgi:hypothetical protein